MANNTTTPETYIAEILNLDLVFTISGSLLSIIGAIVLFIAHYLRSKNGIPLNEPRKYLVFLTIADFCNAVGNLWGAIQFITSKDNSANHVLPCHVVNEPGCVAQSFVTTLPSMSSFFWTTIIAFHLYSTYGEDLDNKVGCIRTAFYHVTGWIIPIIITIIAVSLDVLGSDLSVGSGAWCWISACLSDEKRTIWMTVTGKGWEILMYFSGLAFYMLLKYEQFKRRRQQQRINNLSSSSTYGTTQMQPERETPDDIIYFRFLWLIEVVMRMSGTIRYIIAVVKRHGNKTLPGYDKADSFFLHVQSLGDCAQAFCSCVIFCILDKETRTLLKQLITCQRQNDEEAVPISL